MSVRRSLAIVLLVGFLFVLAAHSPTNASHGLANINARVTQKVSNQGVSSTIETKDPGTMAWPHWSYQRVTVAYDYNTDPNHAPGECPSTAFCYGEVGPYKGHETDNKINPLVVYQTQRDGRVRQRFSSIVLTAGTYYQWKVLNTKNCGEAGTTLDFAWDFCMNTSKLVTYDLQFDLGSSIDSGGEVSGHYVVMMESWLKSNQYVRPDNNTWELTTNVTCADGRYDSTQQKCFTTVDENYQVWYLVQGNDNEWKDDVAFISD